jgi:novel protein kinase C delta type
MSFQRHALDVSYFDEAFTREVARLTPVDDDFLDSVNQRQFRGFSYTNPNYSAK